MQDENKLYEIGYLLSPLVPEEALGDSVNEIRNSIESAGGALVSEDQAKMIDLAYTVCRSISSKKFCVDTAYFGSIKFTIESEKLTALKELIEKNEKVVRYLVVKTTKDNGARQSIFASSPKVASPKVDDEVKPVLSEQEIDKEIEDLLVGTETK